MSPADPIAAALADITAAGIRWNGQAAPKNAERIKLTRDGYAHLPAVVAILCGHAVEYSIRDGIASGPVLTLRDRGGAK